MSTDINIQNVAVMRFGRLPSNQDYFEYLERLISQYESRIKSLESQLADHETRISALENP